MILDLSPDIEERGYFLSDNSRLSYYGGYLESLAFSSTYSGMSAHKSSPGTNSVVTLILD
jgi:hypothetical protein